MGAATAGVAAAPADTGVLLYLPGLEADAIGPSLSRRDPSLAWLLRHAAREARASLGYERTLLQLLGLIGETADELPAAALLVPWDLAGEAAAGWLCADPVHLAADVNQVRLFTLDEVPLEATESRVLVAELNAHFQPDVRFRASDDGRRWYLQATREPLPGATRPPGEARGARIAELLPQGAARAFWRSLLNEAQMLLHNSDINRRRELRGDPPINGIWVWGGGTLSAAPAQRWSALVGSDPLTMAAAHYLGLPHYPKLPDPRPEGALLIVDRALQRSSAPQALEPGYGALLAADARRGLGALVVGDTRCFRVKRWRAWLAGLLRGRAGAR